jgi:predicted DNA-binding transcriptional regulator YafY
MSIKQQTRLDQTIELLLEAYPKGITAPDIADKLGVTRQTSHNDIIHLEQRDFPVAEGELGKYYCIDPHQYVQPLSLTLE